MTPNQYSSQEPTVTILHESKEWETRFDVPIKEIRVDGQKLNDVHDLAHKVDKMATIIKALAFTATFLAIVAVAGISAIDWWLVRNSDKITASMQMTDERFSKRIQNLNHSNTIMSQKLKTLGWVWKGGGWQQTANSTSSPSIQDD